MNPLLKNGSYSAQSSNPLLKIAAGAPKVRTLRLKRQLERPKSEPFAQFGSWSAQSTNPVPKMQPGAPTVQFEIKANCFYLRIAPRYASAGLNCSPLHFLGLLRVIGEGGGG